MKKHIIRRIFTAAAAAVIAAVSGISVPLNAFAFERDSFNEAAVLAEMEADYYSFGSDIKLMPLSDYYDLHCNDAHPSETVTVLGGNYLSAEGSFSIGDYTADGVTKENSLIWAQDGGSVSYSMTAAETGIYCLDITYCPLASGTSSAELSLAIDGEIPFDAASRLTLGAVWENEGAIRTNSRGDQIRPMQVRREMWQSRDLGDPDGLFPGALFFALEKGQHTVTLSAKRAGFVLGELRFHAPDELPSYDEYSASVGANIWIGETAPNRFKIEGEAASFRSDAVLCPNYDNTSYIVSPSDPCRIMYNTIGGDSWKKAQQSITWVIPKESIGADGWYKIGIRARQDKMRGFCSNRRIYIDGSVPCSELDSVSFPYSRDWRVTSPETSEGESVYIYLTADTDHTITLEAVTGEIGEPLRRLGSAVSELNELYRQILMITGPNPDKYNDYGVHEKIPELVDGLRSLSRELGDIQRDIEHISGTSGSEAAVIGHTTVILDKCVDKPILIPSYLARLKDSITSLSAWMREYRDQPLEVDFIEFASHGEDFTSCKKKLGKSLAFGFKAFIGSFFEDYTALNGSSADAIEVWVCLGRDQSQIVSELTESSFIGEYGIPVTVKLVSGGVIEAALAGKAPDAALFLGGEFPVNLAERGLLADVSRMEGFADVTKRFQSAAMTQYSYGDGVYGLPVSQSFPMMFCRTDILSELGITHPPETWDELKDMLPAIQRKYMSVGLVLPSGSISPATEAGHTFAMLLLQNGLSYYSDDMTASALGENAAVKAFEQWTDFYTDYSFEQTYDAFSRFRTGEYPIVISNYSFANRLSASAPEINGLWEFYPVPGTMRSDGTVSHAANSEGSGAVIFESSKNKQAAWEYIKWFTSADIQAQFGMRCEGILGTLGRFETANLEALGRLSWSVKELERLRAQQEELAEIPITPASYAVTRNIMNAFREVINERKNPRDTLLRYNLDINEEIKRKLSQMSKNR